MKKSGLKFNIRRGYEKINRFLTSKDLLIFLFFLAVSASLWTLLALRKTYTTTIEVPLSYADLPKGYVQTAQLPDKLTVTLTDNGTTLAKYKIGNYLGSIEIDAGKYVNGNYTYMTNRLRDVIQKKLDPTSQISAIQPSRIEFKFEKLERKKIPVRMDGRVSLKQQYVLCDSINIDPKEVYVYGTKEAIDTMQWAYTEPVNLRDVKDTLTKEIGLRQSKDIAFDKQTITCTIKTEKYTEKEVQVDIKPINVADGYRLRLFPSRVKVVFHIGLSKYDEIKSNNFEVTADYNERKKNQVPLKVTWPEGKISNVWLKPDKADFVLEEMTEEEKKDEI